MYFLWPMISLAVFCSLVRGTALIPRQDHRRAPWLRVSYCDRSRGKQIIEAALEARVALIVAGRRLKALYKFDALRPIPRLSGMTSELRSTVEMYSTLIDRELLRASESQDQDLEIKDTNDSNEAHDPTAVYDGLREVIDTIRWQLLDNMSPDSQQEIIEITCGYVWLRRPVERWPTGLVNYYFDDRASIAWTVPRERRRIHVRYHPFEGPIPQGAEGKVFQDIQDVYAILPGPLEEVLALSDSAWDRWSQKFTSPDKRTTAESLQRIITTQYPPGTWVLEDIFKKSLTAQLIKYFCQMHSLMGLTRYVPLSVKRRLRPNEDESWDSIVKLAEPPEDLAYGAAENFAYLVLALYLNNTNWMTGVNSGHLWFQ